MHVRIVEAAGLCRLGEGPLWSDREQALYWVDILGHTVHRLLIGTGDVARWHLPGTIGWLLEREDSPGFVAGLGRDIVFLGLDPLSIERVASPEPGGDAFRLNDAKADRAGRVWAGTMPTDGAKESGALFRIDAGGAVSLRDRGYGIPNGPAFSPDGRYLYHTDSLRRVVYRFELADDGSVANRQPFIFFDASAGAPDGMTVDAEGGLWIALWGGSRVSRFTPEGRLERSVRLPTSQITSCAFAGPGLDRLYVTSAREGLDDAHAGALFEVDPGVTGLLPHRFAG